jgi:hypothetical protein
MCGRLIVGAIALEFPEMLGVGYQATDSGLQGDLSLWLLLTLVAVKLAATAVTLGCRFGGGVFSPALFVDAMAGGCAVLQLAVTLGRARFARRRCHQPVTPRVGAPAHERGFRSHSRNDAADRHSQPARNISSEDLFVMCYPRGCLAGTLSLSDLRTIVFDDHTDDETPASKIAR